MRYYKQIILSLIVLSCAFITGNAQEELLFRHLTRNEGLLHDNVTCIVQDSLGYMWFGSHRGLNRYDGYSIDSYKYENGIINSVYYNRVYSIQVAISGWLRKPDWLVLISEPSNLSVTGQRLNPIPPFIPKSGCSSRALVISYGSYRITKSDW